MYRLCRGVAAAERAGHARLIPALGPFVAAFCARPGSGRLLYNLVSAATLHFLLLRFTPLTTPIVATLPFPEQTHTVLSVTCLLGALVAMLADPATYGLLGAGQALGWSRAFSTPPAGRMDAITWMGVSAWRGGKHLLGERFLFAWYRDAEKRSRHAHALGAACFVAFTGVSILPKTLTFGDCLTRGVAAFYLRRRSSSFRAWVASVEGAHLLTWGIRACLLVAAFRAAATNRDDGSVRDRASSALSPSAAIACAGATAAILRFAERRGERRSAKKNGTKNGTSNDAAVFAQKTSVEPRGDVGASVGRLDAAAASVVEVSFHDIDSEGTPKVRRSARVSSRAA